MNTQLSIDTCNSLCAVALSRFDKSAMELITSDTRDLGRGHAEVLADQIDMLLKQAALKSTDISRLAVTTGPGSFTGQRVGLALARTMSASMKIDAVGVGVLDALLMETRELKPNQNAYCAIIDAKRDGAYVKAIDATGTILLDSCLIAVSDIHRHLMKLSDPIAIAGTGTPLLNDLDKLEYDILDLTFPSIATIAEIGHGLDVERHPAVPLYLRDADAKPQSAKHVLRMPGAVNMGARV